MYYLSEQQQQTKKNQNKFSTCTIALQTNTVRRISNKCKNRFFFEYKQQTKNNYYPSKPNTSKSGFTSSLDLNEPRVILHFRLFDKSS